MTKLNQLLAIEKGAKSEEHSRLTELYRLADKNELFEGHVRTYRPVDDDGEKHPPQNKLVQFTADDVMRRWVSAASKLMNVTFSKDVANMGATASVEIDGTTIIEDAPVVFLIALEKKLAQFKQFLQKLPTLDPAEKWHFDREQGLYKTDAHEKRSTSKEVVYTTVAEATKEHPAQVRESFKDVTAGYWNQFRMSGAIPVADKERIIARLNRMIDAVKCAREEANSSSAEKLEVSEDIFSFIFGTTT